MAKVAGSPQGLSWIFLGALGSLSLGVQVACDPGSELGETSQAVRDLLQAVGPVVVQPALARFETENLLLISSLESLSEALASGSSEAETQAAQAQYVQTVAVWQELEGLQIGPAGSSLYVVGGQDLSDEIYSYPNVNRCRSDQETVEEAWDDDAFFEENLANSYGLDSIEYLLFGPLETACPSQVGIDADWQALGPEGVQQNRADFAVVLSEGTLTQAQTLSAAWQGDFGQAMADGSSPYEDSQQALNAVFDALFYLETETKDRKLVEPLAGGEVESPYAATSALWLHHNILGFEQLFFMDESTGFDALLEDQGHGDLSQKIRELTDSALEQSAALDPSLMLAMDSQAAAVEDLLATLSELSTLLKGDLATVLSLIVPSEAAGDAD